MPRRRRRLQYASGHVQVVKRIHHDRGPRFLQVKYAVVETTIRSLRRSQCPDPVRLCRGHRARGLDPKVLAGELGVSITAVKVTVVPSLGRRQGRNLHRLSPPLPMRSAPTNSRPARRLVSAASDRHQQPAAHGVALTVSVVSAPTQPRDASPHLRKLRRRSGMTGAIAGGAGAISGPRPDTCMSMDPHTVLSVDKPRFAATREALYSARVGGAWDSSRDGVAPSRRRGKSVPQPMASSAAGDRGVLEILRAGSRRTRRKSPSAPPLSQWRRSLSRWRWPSHKALTLVAAPQMVQPIMHPPPSQPAWPSMQPAPMEMRLSSDSGARASIRRR